MKVDERKMSKVAFSKNKRSGGSEGIYISTVDKLAVPDRVVSNSNVLQVFDVDKSITLQIYQIQANDLARNSSMFKRTLRTRSQRAYLASAIFVLILIVVLAMIGFAISKKTAKFEDFEGRLRSLERLKGRRSAVINADFDKRLRAVEQLQGRKTSLNNETFDERLRGLEKKSNSSYFSWRKGEITILIYSSGSLLSIFTLTRGFPGEKKIIIKQT